MSDLRSLPDSVLRTYLVSLGAWGVALLLLWGVGYTPVALTLCYPLALWLGGLTLWWWFRTWRRVAAQELETSELQSGARSVGRILAGGGLIPGIVFVSYDPLLLPSWGTFVGIAIVSGIGWAAASALPRFKTGFLVPLVLMLCWAILPVNATGAVSAAAMWGWFDSLMPVDLSVPPGTGPILDPAQ